MGKLLQGAAVVLAVAALSGCQNSPRQPVEKVVPSNEPTFSSGEKPSVTFGEFFKKGVIPGLDAVDSYGSQGIFPTTIQLRQTDFLPEGYVFAEPKPQKDALWCIETAQQDVSALFVENTENPSAGQMGVFFSNAPCSQADGSTAKAGVLIGSSENVFTPIFGEDAKLLSAIVKENVKINTDLQNQQATLDTNNAVEAIETFVEQNKKLPTFKQVLQGSTLFLSNNTSEIETYTTNGKTFSVCVSVKNSAWAVYDSSVGQIVSTGQSKPLCDTTSEK